MLVHSTALHIKRLNSTTTVIPDIALLWKQIFSLWSNFSQCLHTGNWVNLKSQWIFSLYHIWYNTLNDKYVFNLAYLKKMYLCKICAPHNFLTSQYIDCIVMLVRCTRRTWSAFPIIPTLIVLLCWSGAREGRDRHFPSSLHWLSCYVGQVHEKDVIGISHHTYINCIVMLVRCMRRTWSAFPIIPTLIVLLCS